MESKITPRFLAEEHTETVEDPTTSESGSVLEREALGDANVKSSYEWGITFPEESSEEEDSDEEESESDDEEEETTENGKRKKKGGEGDAPAKKAKTEPAADDGK